MPYTIRIREQVTPKYVERMGSKGMESRLSPGVKPVNPQSFVRLICSDVTGLYDADPAHRWELWEDVNGVATWDEIKAQTGAIEYLTRFVKAEAKLTIEKKWPLWAQNNCALGIYGAATVAQCIADIASVITASNTAEDAITNAISMDAALAVKAVWPEL